MFTVDCYHFIVFIFVFNFVLLFTTILYYYLLSFIILLQCILYTLLLWQYWHHFHANKAAWIRLWNNDLNDRVKRRIQMYIIQKFQNMHPLLSHQRNTPFGLNEKPHGWGKSNTSLSNCLIFKHGGGCIMVCLISERTGEFFRIKRNEMNQDQANPRGKPSVCPPPDSGREIHLSAGQ